MAGPSDEFDELYRAHAPAVLAQLPAAGEPGVGGGGGRRDVHDRLAAARRRARAPAALLLGIARRVLSNQRRTARRQRALAERLAAEPAGPAHAGGGGAPVLEALSRLPAVDREVLMLVAWEGFRSAEAARVLGCTPVAARIRLHRARRRLAQALGEHEDELDAPAAAAELRL